MAQVIAIQPDSIQEHLLLLFKHLKGVILLQEDPSQNSNIHDLYEAEIFLWFEIEELINEHFGIKKEAATGHGDYNFNVYKNLVAFSIPAMEQEGKEVQALCH